ncbi:MAG: DUF192 domain-containing protein [Candidatus Omnitrophota bacterium]
MNKKILFYALFVFMMSAMVSGCLSDKQPKVCLGSACLKVEIAQTNEELQRGLQYRETMPRDEGMLFIFPQDVEAGFWMKNTLLPLDMIWLSEAKSVVYIQKNAPPCLQEECPVYGPKESVRYVLEANAGFADANDIQIGQEAKVFLVEKE